MAEGDSWMSFNMDNKAFFKHKNTLQDICHVHALIIK
jgi:hypothetical protein